MNPLTREWIDKADGDMDTAERELRARVRPNFNSACFHSQQTAEKYLKAWLQENGIEVPRIHNLVELVALCIQSEPAFTFIENDLKGLDGFAVRVRYPGHNASKEEAFLAVRIARQVRAFIKDRLPA